MLLVKKWKDREPHLLKGDFLPPLSSGRTGNGGLQGLLLKYLDPNGANNCWAQADFEAGASIVNVDEQYNHTLKEIMRYTFNGVGAPAVNLKKVPFPEFVKQVPNMLELARRDFQKHGFPSSPLDESPYITEFMSGNLHNAFAEHSAHLVYTLLHDYYYSQRSCTRLGRRLNISMSASRPALRIWSTSTTTE